MVTQKKRVAVIFGGRSGEHEVSIISARSIINALDKAKYDVIPVGITREGKWVTGVDPMKALEEDQYDLVRNNKTFIPDPAYRAMLPVRKTTPSIEPSEQDQIPIDVVFPVLHGPMGEDGSVQGLLELAGIPYVGAGILASSVGMDKVAMKMIFESRGFPIPRYRAYLRSYLEKNMETALQDIETHLSYPLFVKPANLGSSVGISKAKNRSALQQAMVLASKYDRKLLVEEGINAREIECAVLGNDDPVASLPGEIVPCNEFYDYSAKYLDDRSQIIIPANIPENIRREIMHLSVESFKAIDCSGMARVDFLLEKDTMKIYLNELNTIPGFTPISMYPKMWEASGIPYKQLLDKLIDLAIDRFNEKNKSRTSLDQQDLN